MERIHIRLPYRQILEREERWNRAVRFEQPDRIPVIHYIGSRYWLPLIRFCDANRMDEYTRTPRAMLKCQLLLGRSGFLRM